MLNSYQLAPLSLLIAGLLVFGTFVQRSEYTATLAGGIGLKRIIVAPTIVAVIATITMFFINEIISPPATSRATFIEAHYFGEIRSDNENQRSGVFWPQLQGGWKCDIRTFNRQALTGETVFIYLIGDERHEQIEARRIFWDENQNEWILEQGTRTIIDLSQEPGRDTKRMTSKTTRITQEKAPFNESPEYLFTSEIDTQTQSIAQLAGLIKKHKSQSTTARRMKLDLNKKIVDPILCILFTILAIPFSIRLGRGGISIGLSVAIFMGLGYLVLASITQSMGYSGQISPIFAAWFPFAVYFSACSFLILRTPT